MTLLRALRLSLSRILLNLSLLLQDLTEDLSAVQSRWLSNDRRQSDSTSNPAAALKTPDVEAMDMDTYSKNLNAMNTSLHDLQGDIQRLAQQQSQIQQMMHSPHQQQQQPQQSVNPMDPQPFYISGGESMPQQHHPQPHQRRTWGQPQPINFAHDPQYAGGYGGAPRRSWGQPAPPPHHSPQRPMMSGYGPSSSVAPYGAGDPYSSPYGQPHHPPPHPHHPPHHYNGGNSPYDPQSFQSGYGSPNYSNSYQQQQHHPQQQSPMQQHQPPQSSYMSPPQQSMSTSSPSRGAPFRLHDKSAYNASPSSTMQQQRQQPSASSPPQHGEDPYRSGGSSTTGASIHTSVPAPQEDDMAPQNVSFIDTEDEANAAAASRSRSRAKDHDDNGASSSGPDSSSDAALKRLPERLSQLNISSGSKTYRVTRSGGSDHEADSSGTGGGAKSPSPSPSRQRPTISSAFKQNRRGSGGDSGPSSLRSNPRTTEEEEEALAKMKTERLKVDKDAAAGFVISFDDDDKPKKPKPELKPRRPSSKRFSMTGSGLPEMASDGSNSSRKENVPPEVMICIVSCIVLTKK